MVWQPNILINCYELSGGYAPEPPTRGSAPGPRWGTSVPQTPCATHLQILATPLVDVSVSEQWQQCGLARTVLLLSDEYMNVPVLYTLCSC